jgi:hypothetical protein
MNMKRIPDEIDLPFLCVGAFSGRRGFLSLDEEAHRRHVSQCMRLCLNLPVDSTRAQLVSSLEEHWISKQKWQWRMLVDESCTEEQLTNAMLSWYEKQVGETRFREGADVHKLKKRITSRVEQHE